jgi:hypothetical protein
MVEATRKAMPDAAYYAYAPGIGAESTYVFVASVSDLAQLNGWIWDYHARIAGTHGKAAADPWWEEIRDTIVGVETMIARERP